MDPLTAGLNLATAIVNGINAHFAALSPEDQLASAQAQQERLQPFVDFFNDARAAVAKVLHKDK